MNMRTRESLRASWNLTSRPEGIQANLFTVLQVLLDLRDQNAEILQAVKENPLNIPPRTSYGETAFKEFHREIIGSIRESDKKLFGDIMEKAMTPPTPVDPETKGGIYAPLDKLLSREYIFGVSASLIEARRQ
jgi:hypothetical protein